jgi:hypothetical protein
MDEQALEDFLLGKIDGKDFAEKVFNKPSYKDGGFLLTRNHLLKLCDLAIERKIGVGLLESLSDHLMFSDHFKWDKESEEGDLVSQTIFEWGNPTTNYEINELNLKLWKEYLQTGEYKLGDFNNWNSHIQKQKDTCTKANSDWRPVNPKHKIGISDNLDQQPVHGLRHSPEKGTTGWFIWTGEYSPADDFFKPIHAVHLLERRPDLIKYLALPPGYRFLVDDKGHEDIWEDKQLLDVDTNVR